MLSIMEVLDDLSDSLRQFILDNQSNPVLWIGIIVGGLLIFTFTYNSLNKNG